jgi:hypothetical protein
MSLAWIRGSPMSKIWHCQNPFRGILGFGKLVTLSLEQGSKRMRAFGRLKIEVASIRQKRRS